MSNLNPGGLTRVLNYIKTWVTGLLNDKANSGHTHDDRYYTETLVSYMFSSNEQYKKRLRTLSSGVIKLMRRSSPSSISLKQMIHITYLI